MIERIAEARRHCRAFHVAYDIGAHRGWYALEMADHFARVVAFEPTTRNFKELVANTFYSRDNIEAYCLGVSDRQRDEWFDVSGKPNGYHISNDATNGELCKLITLDGFVSNLGEESNDYAPDFIKIDVEGHEASVLRGAKKMITSHKPVIMIEEKFDPALTATGLLTAWGYSQVWRKKHDRLFVCKSS